MPAKARSSDPAIRSDPGGAFTRYSIDGLEQGLGPDARRPVDEHRQQRRRERTGPDDRRTQQILARALRVGHRRGERRDRARQVEPVEAQPGDRVPFGEAGATLALGDARVEHLPRQEAVSHEQRRGRLGQRIALVRIPERSRAGLARLDRFRFAQQRDDVIAAVIPESRQSAECLDHAAGPVGASRLGLRPLHGLDQQVRVAGQARRVLLLERLPPEHAARQQEDRSDRDDRAEELVLPDLTPCEHDERLPADPNRLVIRDAQQVASQVLAIGVAILRLLREQLCQHRLEIARRTRDESTERRRPPVQHRLQQRLGGVTVERQAAGHALEQRDAERVEVARGTGAPTLRLLGRGVVERAEEAALPGQGARLLVEELRQSEVRERERTVGMNEDVPGLDVTMEDPAPVCVRERVRHAREPPRCLATVHRGFAEPARVLDVLVEADTVDLLHREVQQPTSLAVAVDRDDVLMVKRRGRARLGTEAIPHVRVGGELRGEHLERDDAFERLLPRLVDRAHPAATEHADDAKVAEALRHVGRHLSHQRIDVVERLQPRQQILRVVRTLVPQLTPVVATGSTRSRQQLGHPLVGGVRLSLVTGRRPDLLHQSCSSLANRFSARPSSRWIAFSVLPIRSAMSLACQPSIRLSTTTSR